MTAPELPRRLPQEDFASKPESNDGQHGPDSFIVLQKASSPTIPGEISIPTHSATQQASTEQDLNEETFLGRLEPGATAWRDLWSEALDDEENDVTRCAVSFGAVAFSALKRCYELKDDPNQALDYLDEQINKLDRESDTFYNLPAESHNAHRLNREANRLKLIRLAIQAGGKVGEVGYQFMLDHTFSPI